MIDGGTPQISFLSHLLADNNISVPIVGISKFGGDKLVYRAQTKKAWRDLAENIKPTLLKLREEAHRFANFGRKRSVQAPGAVPRTKPQIKKTIIRQVVG
jgi:excinuclease UvrABC nuclease subunit